MGPSWLYGSWIRNYLCNQCLSCCGLELCWWRGVLDTTLCDKVCQCLAVCRWLSLGTPVSSTYKTDHHDIAEIVLKVALNTINNINTVFNFVPFFPLASVVFIHPIPHENQVLLALPIFSGVRVARSLVCCF